MPRDEFVKVFAVVVVCVRGEGNVWGGDAARRRLTTERAPSSRHITPVPIP